jgi:hypothetical protein
MNLFFNTGIQQVYKLHILTSIHTAISSYVQLVHTNSLKNFSLNYRVLSYFIPQKTIYLSSVCLPQLKTQSCKKHSIYVYDDIAERLDVCHYLCLFRVHATFLFHCEKLLFPHCDLELLRNMRNLLNQLGTLHNGNCFLPTKQPKKKSISL